MKQTCRSTATSLTGLSTTAVMSSKGVRRAPCQSAILYFLEPLMIRRSDVVLKSSGMRSTRLGQRPASCEAQKCEQSHFRLPSRGRAGGGRPMSCRQPGHVCPTLEGDDKTGCIYMSCDAPCAAVDGLFQCQNLQPRCSRAGGFLLRRTPLPVRSSSFGSSGKQYSTWSTSGISSPATETWRQMRCAGCDAQAASFQGVLSGPRLPLLFRGASVHPTAFGPARKQVPRPRHRQSLSKLSYLQHLGLHRFHIIPRNPFHCSGIKTLPLSPSSLQVPLYALTETLAFGNLVQV